MVMSFAESEYMVPNVAISVMLLALGCWQQHQPLAASHESGPGSLSGRVRVQTLNSASCTVPKTQLSTTLAFNIKASKVLQLRLAAL